MLQFYKQAYWQSFLSSPVVLIILMVLIFLSGQAVYERYQIEREMAGRRIEIEAKVKAMEARRSVLRNKVEYLSEPRGIEAEVRRNFDVAEVGEKVVIIIDDDKSEAIQPLADKTETRPTLWYKFWEKLSSVIQFEN